MESPTNATYIMYTRREGDRTKSPPIAIFIFDAVTQGCTPRLPTHASCKFTSEYLYCTLRGPCTWRNKAGVSTTNGATSLVASCWLTPKFNRPQAIIMCVWQWVLITNWATRQSIQRFYGFCSTTSSQVYPGSQGTSCNVAIQTTASTELQSMEWPLLVYTEM